MQNQGQQFTDPMNPMGNGAGVGAPMNGGGMSGMPANGGGMMPANGNGGMAPRPLNNMAASVATKIENASNILVALSKDPSVDEISAALGLTMILDAMGKHVTAIYSGRTPNAVKFLKPEKTFETNANSLQDFIIALNKDKADHLRYKVDGDFVKVYITPYKTTITENDLEFSHGDFNVDLVVSLGVETEGELDAALAEHGRIMHDAGSINITIEPAGKFAEMEWSEPGASSVCEMVTKLFEQFRNKPQMTPEVATALLTGIVANTDRFMNEKTTPEVMGVASKLMQSGANQMTISMNISKDRAPMKMGAQKSEEELAKDEADKKELSEKKEEPETDEENVKKMDEELAKPLKHKDEKLTKDEKERSKEAKELDDLAASVMEAVGETDAEKKTKEKSKFEDQFDDLVSEKTEEKPKELLDEKSFEDKLMEEREAASKFGEGLPNAPKEHKVPGSGNVNEREEEEKDEGRIFEREKDEDETPKPDKKFEEDEKSAKKQLDEMVSKNIPTMGAMPAGVMDELKEMSEKPEESKPAFGQSVPTMGAMPAEMMRGMIGETSKGENEAIEGIGPRESTRLDTTGAKNVHDLAKMNKGVVLTEEMSAEDVLGEESAAASEKVLNSDIYPELHDLPENPVITPTRKKDYGAMMDSALAEPLPGMASNSAQSPIAQAPVAQGPNLQGLQNMLNPAAQMAPQVANQPEANHIPTMEYIPDGAMGNEVPAQMNGQYLTSPQMTQPMNGMPQVQPTEQMQAMPQMNQMGVSGASGQMNSMGSMPQMGASGIGSMSQMGMGGQMSMQQAETPQPMTPQQLAMQVMSQMSPTQQQPVMGKGKQQQPQIMTPPPQSSGNGINFPAPPAPPVDFSQMMPPTDASTMNTMPQTDASAMGAMSQMQAMPQMNSVQTQMQQAPQMPQQPLQPTQSMTAGQLYQQNDPSAFRIPGM